MENDGAIFHELQNLGKGRLFKMVMESLGFLFQKYLNYLKMDAT